MPTTANGTPYTLTTTTLSNGDRAIVSVSDAARGSTVPIILYAHGNGGPYNQFSTDGNWKPTRDWAIDNNFAYCESDGGGDTWAGPAGRTAYELLLVWARSVLRVSYIVVLARSMNGLIGYWLATGSSFAADVVGLIVNSGTTDLTYRYANATGPDLLELNAAYSVPGTAVDIPTFTANSVGYDPMLFPTSVWVGKRVLQLGGSDDTTVPYAIHGGAWWTKYNSYLAIPPSGYAIQPGGTHTGPINSYQQVTEMTSFMSAVLPPVVLGNPTPVSQIFFKENGRFRLITGTPIG